MYGTASGPVAQTQHFRNAGGPSSIPGQDAESQRLNEVWKSCLYYDLAQWPNKQTNKLSFKEEGNKGQADKADLNLKRKDIIYLFS